MAHKLNVFLDMFALANIRFHVVMLFLVLTGTACSSLQYRESDTEIEANFSKAKIPTEISYYNVDSLETNIRIQSVTSKNNKYSFVFLHGAPSSLSAWRDYLKDTKLLDGANMYAIDRPGYGYSNFGKELTSIDTQARIVDAIINHKKLDNVVVVGASYGGPIAARTAVINPKVIGVVLISPAIDPLNEKDIWASRLTQWKLSRWLVPTGFRVAGDEKSVHAKELAAIEKEWNKLQVPVIHIHGDTDELVPYENITYSKAHFKNLEIISIPNKGHEIGWEHPELIIPHLMKFIR